MTETPQTPEAEDEISLLDLLQTIVDNLRLLIIGPLVVGLAALGISFAVTPTFTAQVAFLPPQQQQGMAASMLASLGALGGLAGAATGLKTPPTNTSPSSKATASKTPSSTASSSWTGMRPSSDKTLA